MTTERNHTMTGLTCQHCSAPSTNGTVLCKRCVTTAQIALDNVASYHGDLLSIGRQTSRVRRQQGTISDPTGTAAAGRPTPHPDDPDEAAADTRTMLVGWTRVLVDAHPRVYFPRDTVAAMTTLLHQHIGSIAIMEWAGEMVRDLLQVERRLRRIIERSKGRWYAGICSAELEAERPHSSATCLCDCHAGLDQACSVEGGCTPELLVIPAVFCDRDLYATPGSTYVTCPQCRTQWLLHERRHIMLEAARDTLLPVQIIASAVVSLIEGEPSTRRLTERLNKWVQRGTIDDYGVRYVLGRPVRVYRLGDVLDTLGQTRRRTAS
jgi:hypothetical protein